MFWYENIFLSEFSLIYLLEFFATFFFFFTVKLSRIKNSSRCNGYTYIILHTRMAWVNIIKIRKFQRKEFFKFKITCFQLNLYFEDELPILYDFTSQLKWNQSLNLTIQQVFYSASKNFYKLITSMCTQLPIFENICNTASSIKNFKSLHILEQKQG